MNRLERLRGNRSAILTLAKQYGPRSVRIFGSVARCQASDIDILVDFEPGRSLLDQIGFEQGVADLLAERVEVVAEGGISPYLESRILGEAIVL